MDLSTIIVIGFLIIAVTFLWLKKLSRDLEQEVAKVTKDIENIMSKVLFMRIENHDNMIFAYNAITDDYICQGKDMDELNVNFGLRYPHHKGVLIEPKKEEA